MYHYVRKHKDRFVLLLMKKRSFTLIVTAGKRIEPRSLMRSYEYIDSKVSGEVPVILLEGCDV